MIGAGLALFVPFRLEFPKRRPIFTACTSRLCGTSQKPCFEDTKNYNFQVARGWESKSVEEQQAQAVSVAGPPQPPLTPEQSASQRQRQGLLLSRQHVLQQLEAARNPRHREILQSALADLDSQIARLV